MGHTFLRMARYALPLALGVSVLAASCSESIPIPLPQPTATATLLPSATPTSVVSPTATMPPTATATPILAADEALQAGLRHQRNGDYQAAVGVYQSILSSYPDSSEARDALYHLGEVYLLDHNYSGAVEALLQFRERYPDDERYPFATFRLTTAYENLGLWDEAITAYQEYGEQRTIISDYVHLNVGYALLELERYEEARDEFAQVLSLAPPLTLEQQALRNMALASRYLDEYEQAIAYYRQLLDKTQEDASRAETL
ncbi:MAG: tetratricopeptide repeat protein, partial [Anaerolineae bacterium]